MTFKIHKFANEYSHEKTPYTTVADEEKQRLKNTDTIKI